MPFGTAQHCIQDLWLTWDIPLFMLPTQARMRAMAMLTATATALCSSLLRCAHNNCNSYDAIVQQAVATVTPLPR